MTTLERHAAGLLRRSEVCEELGVSRHVLQHHLDLGRIPSGIVVAGDVLFPREQVVRMKSYFANRRKWQR